MKIEAINLSDLPEEQLQYAVMVYESDDGAGWRIFHVARQGVNARELPSILLSVIADSVDLVSEDNTEDARAAVMAEAMSLLSLVLPPDDSAAPDA